MRRLIPAIICFILVAACIFFLIVQPKFKQEVIERTPVYLASEGEEIKIYAQNENYELHPYIKMVRGTEITSRNKIVEIENSEDTFTEVEIGETDEKGNPIVYFVNSNSITTDLNDVVRETVKYVRTSSTVYKTSDGPDIATFIKKGACVEVLGFSDLDTSKGTVRMYKVNANGTEGYIYSKYLVDSQSEADKVYSNIYSIHEGREYYFELYGGSTSNLDWYPVEKPVLSQGPILDKAKAMYLCISAAAPDKIDDYIELAVSSGVNAIVLDIKDGALAYESDVAKELSPTSYQNSIFYVDTYKAAVEKILNAGIYAIGRIVVFNDYAFAADHPEDCIVSDVSDALWPSAYSRTCWEYNVKLAIEAVELFGFNEIQFDYVRFPESAYGMSEAGTTDFKNTYNEDKGEAIQNFCYYATDSIHNAGAYVSVDVFGECSSTYITAYGQYWPAISNVVDAISGMPYTDHFGSEYDTWSDPYTTVYDWALSAAARQEEIETPAIVRTWITGYDTPNWDPTVTYGYNALTTQAQALVDAGLTGGFIPWNGVSSYAKYESYARVWSNSY